MRCGTEKAQNCQKPENLRSMHEECTPGQIEKCRGDTKSYPCVTRKASHRAQP
jgi:hypothetical protein